MTSHTRSRSRRRRRPPRHLLRPLPPPALDLADAFIADHHAADGPDTHETIRCIILAAGELICGFRPIVITENGRW